MKVRDSGMPDEATWDRFFDPREILDALSFDNAESNVIDFGCGYGTFTIATAERTSGMVYAIDIDPAMIAATGARAAKMGLGNVTTVLRDFVADGTGLPGGIAGYAMLFNILHAENPRQLLDEARRLLSPGGRLAVIHWIVDAGTPRGPPLSIRPGPEDCQRWLVEASFELLVPHVRLPPWHYGIVARRPARS
jgi:SAM-dependent methyltransferase